MITGCAFGDGGDDAPVDDRGDVDVGDNDTAQQMSCDPTSVLEGVGFAGERFGNTVAAYEDLLIVGAPATLAADEVPKVHVLELTEIGYLGKAELEPLSEYQAKNFGEAVAVSVDTVVVGSRGDDLFGDPYRGSAHVFVRELDGSWSRQTTLRPSDGAEYDYFGNSVAIDGNRLVVGAYNQDEFATGGGAAYVYERENGSWTQVAKLSPNDPQEYGTFGWSVSIHGSLIAVGAYGADANEGATYVFARGTGGTWSQQAKLKSLSPEVYDGFGKSTAVWGDQVAVGAPSAGIGGRVTVFAPRVDGKYVAIDEVVPRGIEPNDSFGSSLAVRDGTMIVGAEYADPSGELSAGAAWMFTQNGDEFGDEIELLAEDGAEFDHLGGAVALTPNGPVAGIGQRDRGEMTDAGATLTYACE